MRGSGARASPGADRHCPRASQGGGEPVRLVLAHETGMEQGAEVSAFANTGTVLDRILEARRAYVEHRKKVLPETAPRYGVRGATQERTFSRAQAHDGLN